LLTRHQSLRTVFVEIQGLPYQVVTPVAAETLPVVDLSALPETLRQPSARALAAAQGSIPFDLARGPLLHARLLSLGSEEHLLVLVMHHAVADLWSLGIFLQELAVLYDRFRSGTPALLPDLPIQYADFAVWQREWLAGEVQAEQLAYWRRQLAG